ncbi:MAG: uroporphyrinogen decarboxylase family protein [Phycisphaerae bacterium]
MTGLQRIDNIFSRRPVNSPGVLPIIHTGLAGCFNVPLGLFFSNAPVMSEVIVEGYRRFGFDGVQLSMGVTLEAEALGASVDQPTDGAPILKEHLLSDPGKLTSLLDKDPSRGGRVPMFIDASKRVVEQIGREAFVLITLRGPLLMATQLRGVEATLMDTVENPELLKVILDFTADISLRLGKSCLGTGACGLVLGEATCSPNLISPDLYRRWIQPRHQRLVSELKQAGWPVVGLHICGQILPILEDVISTGVDFVDVDYQVDAQKALSLVKGRVVLRGNLDPASIFRFGTVEQVKKATSELVHKVRGTRWILSGGCDIPAGTPEMNLKAFMEETRDK